VHAKSDHSSNIIALLLKKQGRPLALDESLNAQVQQYIRTYVCALRLARSPVSFSLVLAAASHALGPKDMSRERIVTHSPSFGHVLMSFVVRL